MALEILANKLEDFMQKIKYINDEIKRPFAIQLIIVLNRYL